MRVVTFCEKHHDRRYDASTPENLHNACKMILKERIKEGYWYADDDDPGESEWLADVKKYLELGADARLRKKSTEPALYELLEQRSDYEYEGIDLDYVPVVDAEGNCQ